jgi:hypothetical protein
MTREISALIIPSISYVPSSERHDRALLQDLIACAVESIGLEASLGASNHGLKGSRRRCGVLTFSRRPS